MSSLVVQTSFLGDTVLTTPLVSRLAESGPVDVLATRGSAALLANHPAIREVLVYDKRGADRGVAGFARLAVRLRGRRYDAAYLAQGSVRSAALALAAGVPRRVGFDTSAGRRMYTALVPYHVELHHAARLLALSGADGDELRDVPPPRLYPGDGERAAVDALLRAAGHDGEPIVALAPGSVWATKRWPYYDQLARLLTARGARLAVVGGEEDRPLAEAIAAAAGPGHAPIDAVGKLSLLASAELIGRAAAIVTNDSAPQHLASAMGTPTVTIFGPTVPEFGFGPLAPRRATLGRDALDCRPCDRHGPRKCPLGHWRCMRELGAPAVAESVERLLAR
ncbi:MAG: lipopolysaccharide heptosyltransferase II [Gemmatimonadaceae bacterium]